MRGSRFHSAQALLGVLALAAALTLLLAIRASSGGADLAIFLSSPISPVVTPTPTATLAVVPIVTITPITTPIPTETPAVEESRRYLPLIQVTGRTRLWLPIVLQ